MFCGHDSWPILCTHAIHCNNTYCKIRVVLLCPNSTRKHNAGADSSRVFFFLFVSLLFAGVSTCRVLSHSFSHILNVLYQLRSETTGTECTHKHTHAQRKPEGEIISTRTYWLRANIPNMSTHTQRNRDALFGGARQN